MIHYRINNPQTIDQAEIEKLAAKGRAVIQFSTAGYPPDMLRELNSLARTLGRTLEVRFFGHHTEEFDASVLRFIPDAPCVSLDCLTTAHNLEALSNLVSLKELRLGVFEMDLSDILSLASLQGVESLILGEIRKPNVDLSYLQNYDSLTNFHTTGQTKNINVLVTLPSLRSLSLSMIKNTECLAFVSEIKHLSYLRIMLGGRRSISEISGKELRTLEICRVRGLQDLGVMSRFPKLEDFVVEDQIQLRRTEFGPNPRLRSIKILNCKTLEQVDGIGSLDGLKTLQIYKTAMDYQKFISSKLPKSLENLSFHTGKRKDDEDIRKDLVGKGFSECVAVP